LLGEFVLLGELEKSEEQQRKIEDALISVIHSEADSVLASAHSNP
jgi:hypothetical protein